MIYFFGIRIMVYATGLIVKKKWLSAISHQLSAVSVEKRFAFSVDVFYNTHHLNLDRKAVSISPHGKPSKSF